jgi:preprotein translocase subunit SecG
VTAFLTILHIVACIFLVAVVLLQHGKGADIGAAFGSGASSTVFGSRGAGNFLTKLTTGTVVVFMLTSIALSYFGTPRSVADLIEEPTIEVPAEPVLAEPEVPEAETGGEPAAPPLGNVEPIPSPDEGSD